MEDCRLKFREFFARREHHNSICSYLSNGYATKNNDNVFEEMKLRRCAPFIYTHLFKKIVTMFLRSQK
jgi:hypothetical protein